MQEFFFFFFFFFGGGGGVGGLLETLSVMSTFFTKGKKSINAEKNENVK